MTGGQPSFPSRGELQDCLDIVTGEFRELSEKLVRRHSSCQVFKDIVDRDAGPSSAPTDDMTPTARVMREAYTTRVRCHAPCRRCRGKTGAGSSGSPTGSSRTAANESTRSLVI